MHKEIEDLLLLIAPLNARDQKFVAQMMRTALITIENRNTMTEDQRAILKRLNRENWAERFKIRGPKT